MTEHPTPSTDRDDAEGHGTRHPMQGEQADTTPDDADDVQGHRRHFFGVEAERDETDDAEGHGVRLRPQQERSGA